jgi:alpha-amylase
MAQINGTMMQYFHWYAADDGTFWKQLATQAQELAATGFTALWLPPAYKGSNGPSDVGYSTYDLFDLGEFDQKGSVRTKYGTHKEFLDAVKTSQAAGLDIYADVVFNHKNGGDEKERVTGTPVDCQDRNCELGPPRDIEIWTRFNFPGRGDRYSTMKWNASHFDSVNHNALDSNDRTIYKIQHKQFELQVNPRLSNYDFLMGCDLDMNSQAVCDELINWGKWFLERTGVNGFRLDAVKHIQFSFFKEWLSLMREHSGNDLFSVAEYWDGDVQMLHNYLQITEGKTSLFDVPLHFNFHKASKSGNNYDMRQIFDNTLMQQQPNLAVTFVDNHDSQPLQALESYVESWFKPLAYALILLRPQGYPCIFYADYYGANYKDYGKDGHIHEVSIDSHRWLIDKLLYARKHYAYGDCYDYFDRANLIGWTRIGTVEHPKAMAAILSNGEGGSKWMQVQKPNRVFYDLTEHIKEPIQTNENGWGEFSCRGGSVSVWVEK